MVSTIGDVIFCFLPKHEQEAALNIEKLFKRYKEAQPGSKERYDIGDVLEDCEESDVAGLLSHLNDEDKDIRVLAIWGLGFTRDRRAYEPLLAILLKGEKDELLRYYLIQAIGKLEYNDIRAVPALLKALLKDKDSDIRRVAAYALESFDDERVIWALRKASTSDVPRVEEAAKASLGYIMRKRYAQRTTPP